MTDFQGIKFLYADFRRGMRDISDGKKISPDRDDAEVLRVRFWYEGIRQRTGLNSAYSLEQHFEPESFRVRIKDGAPSHRCKWQGYKVGQHTPQSRLVERVNTHLPGSLQEIYHPLWDILKKKPDSSALSEALLKRLKPDVQAVLYAPLNGNQVFLQRAKVTRVLLAKLERIASLDSLAALIWLLYEALDQNNRKRLTDIVTSIYAVLLMIGIWWQERHLSGPMMNLFVGRILALYTPQYLRFFMSTQEIIKASTVLNLIVFHTKSGKSDNISWRQRARVMRNLLSVNTGLDVASALAPVYIPIPGEAGIPSSLLEQLEYQERLRKWGWDCIKSGKAGQFPEQDVFSES